MLGWHWLAHATGADPVVLDDADALSRLLLDLAASMGLTPVAQPVVAPARDGLAGIVLLAESHAAIHVDRAACEAMIDVFSCRPLDGAAAADRVRTALQATDLRWRIAARAPGAEREVS